MIQIVLGSMVIGMALFLVVQAFKWTKRNSFSFRLNRIPTGGEIFLLSLLFRFLKNVLLRIFMRI